MTLKLVIIRHAKSSWDDPLADDHDRRLNKRGRESADAIGDWLAEQRHVPDLCLCSTAARTVETWSRITARLEGDPQVIYRSALYHASAEAILREMQGMAAEPTLAIVGHNPGIGVFAGAMVAARPDHPDFTRYPTGAATVLEFDIPAWANARPQTGRALEFVVPRGLTGRTKF